MTPEDIPAIMVLEQVSFPTPWSEATYRRELRNRHASYWVMRPGPMVSTKNTAAGSTTDNVPPVLAYGGLWHMGDEAHITTIATHPAYRRQHLGEWLLLRLIGVARGIGAHSVTLEVRMSNAAAQALYAKLGFESVGIRRGYYQDTGEDARLLTLFAIDHPAVWAKLSARIQELEEAG